MSLCGVCVCVCDRRIQTNMHTLSMYSVYSCLCRLSETLAAFLLPLQRVITLSECQCRWPSPDVESCFGVVTPQRIYYLQGENVTASKIMQSSLALLLVTNGEQAAMAVTQLQQSNAGEITFSIGAHGTGFLFFFFSVFFFFFFHD